MAEKMCLYQVDHPEYGKTTTPAKDDGGAVKEAANTWGVAFREIAGDCKVTKLGSALRPSCKRCHGEYGQPGDPSAYCPECEKALEAERRLRPRFRREDRRVAGERG